MLWTLIVLLLLFWVLGFAFDVAVCGDPSDDAVGAVHAMLCLVRLARRDSRSGSPNAQSIVLRVEEVCGPNARSRTLRPLHR